MKRYFPGLLTVVMMVPAAGCGGTGMAARPVAATAVAPAVEASLARLERGESVANPCFAANAAGDVLCAVGAWNVLEGGALELRLLGRAPETLTYYRLEPGEILESVDPGRVERAAFARARALVEQHGLVPFGPGEALLASGQVHAGAHLLRRTRTQVGVEGDAETGEWAVFRDAIELDCGGAPRTLALPGDAFSHSIGEPAVTVRALEGGTLLMTASVRFSLEGEQGGAVDAVVLEPAAQCR